MLPKEIEMVFDPKDWILRYIKTYFFFMFAKNCEIAHAQQTCISDVHSVVGGGG